MRDEFQFELGQGFLFDSKQIICGSQDLDPPIELATITEKTEDMRPECLSLEPTKRDDSPRSMLKEMNKFEQSLSDTQKLDRKESISGASSSQVMQPSVQNLIR